MGRRRWPKKRRNLYDFVHVLGSSVSFLGMEICIGLRGRFIELALGLCFTCTTRTTTIMVVPKDLSIGMCHMHIALPRFFTMTGLLYALIHACPG